jgi:hypothetical protein
MHLNSGYCEVRHGVPLYGDTTKYGGIKNLSFSAQSPLKLDSIFGLDDFPLLSPSQKIVA